MIECGVVACVVFFQEEDGIRDLVGSGGLGDVYKRQGQGRDRGLDEPLHPTPAAVLEVGEHPSRREDPTHLGERALHIGDRAEHQGGDNRIERPILEGQRLGPSVNGLHRYAALPPIEATLQVRPHRRERLNQRHVIRCGVMAPLSLIHI